MADPLIRELTGGVLRLTLNRPDKRNALNTAMIESLLAELEEARLSAEVRVVLLKGSGKDFCAGADLRELLDSVDNTPEENAAQAMKLGSVFVAIRQLEKPVVAAVHGRALAGGCGLATACDLVVAKSSSSFGYPEIQRGFVPAMVMAMLRRAVGEKVAFDLVSTGHILSATDASAVGLVSRVVSDDQFDTAVEDIVSTYASNSASALGLIKKQLYELEARDFEAGIRLGADVNAVARSTPDFRDAVSRFFEKQ